MIISLVFADNGYK